MDEKLTGRPEVRIKAMDRRDVIKTGLKIGGAAYAAPTILGVAQHVGAQGVTPGINPQCVGATCGTFGNCNGNPNCVCFATSDGRGFCYNNLPFQSCSDVTALPSCVNGSCPAGSICAVNTCCNRPICIAVAHACPTSLAGVNTQPVTPPAGTGPYPGTR